MRKRSVWIEPLFGEAKQWHQFVQFRLRRLLNVNIQALLIAAGQNIKRLLKRRPSTKRFFRIRCLSILEYFLLYRPFDFALTPHRISIKMRRCLHL